ncbi:AAA family ATPase [Dermatophilaceae bacterium Sec6.4]
MSVTVVTAVSAHAEAAVATALGASTRLQVVRRCPDVADLLAIAQSGRAQVAVISPDLPGVRRSVLSDLRAGAVAVVGVFDPADETQERVLRQWDVARVVSIHAVQTLVDEVCGAAAGAAAVGTESGAAYDSSALDAQVSMLERLVASSDGETSHGIASELPAEEVGTDTDQGQIVTVWGAVGAPGRTTVAVNLAAELARVGKTALIVDADTYGACVGQFLALLDEAPGVAAAVRLAESGRLDVPSLAAVAPVVLPGLRVLTGISRASRWPELREDALTEVLRTAAMMVDFVVVDCAGVIEEDEELSYDTVAPRRNAATLAALRAADVVFAVGTADPVGLQRLVRALEDVRPVIEAEPRVVVTRVRSSAVGASARTKIAEALCRFAGVRDLTLVPEDREGLDGALLTGTVLAAVAPASAARLALADLAADLSGVPPAGRRGRIARLRRSSLRS